MATKKMYECILSTTNEQHIIRKWYIPGKCNNGAITACGSYIVGIKINRSIPTCVKCIETAKSRNRHHTNRQNRIKNPLNSYNGCKG